MSQESMYTKPKSVITTIQPFDVVAAAPYKYIAPKANSKNQQII